MYGLFGGEPKDLARAQKILGRKLINIYQVPVTDSQWKWRNGDLSLTDWFRNFGHTIDFNILYLIEWDLLQLGSFEDLYSRVPANGVGLTGLIAMKKIPKWNWIAREPWKGQWNDLLAYAKEEYGYRGVPHGCLGPGNVFPRAFVEKYSEIEVPVLCHEEIRFPLFAQILGFKLFDNGFFKDWSSHDDAPYFSCAGKKIGIQKSVMDEEMEKATGRRCFHPCKEMFRISIPDNPLAAFLALENMTLAQPLKSSAIQNLVNKRAPACLVKSPGII